MQKIIIIFSAILIAWLVFFKDGRVSLGPGVMAPDTPMQEKIVSEDKYVLDEYTITPLEEFHIKAKVLARKNYSWGRESDISPLDLALGWGKMSDESVLEKIEISQSNRWYRWKTAEFPIPRKEIETHSANMHFIPANKYVESRMDDVREGQVVEITGKLVRVDAVDGWHWVSSLTRNDTGSHACEVVWVDDFEIREF